MKTLSQLQNYIIRKGRISVDDTASTTAIIEDLNDAIGVIASLRNWDELYVTKNLSLSLSDGDTIYPLDSTVDKVELVRITLPVDYAKEVIYVPRREVLAVLGAKSNNGTGTPNRWYYAEPTVASNNQETKNISFDIMPDRSYTVAYTYRKYAPALVNPGDYPFFDSNYHHILGYYCLWQYSERNPDVTMNPDTWESKWNDGVSSLLSAYTSKVTINSPIPGPVINL